MPSRTQRGGYGTGKNITDWQDYNPLGVRTTPIKEEYLCPLCEKYKDQVFPIRLELCETCLSKIVERKGEIYYKYQRKIFDPTGMFCINDAHFYPTMFIVNTRICHNCTVRLGKNQREFNKRLHHARKVA